MIAPRVPLTGRTVVVVDDGIATGSTAKVACQGARAEGAARVVLAVPVAPAGWIARHRVPPRTSTCPWKHPNGSRPSGSSTPTSPRPRTARWSGASNAPPSERRAHTSPRQQHSPTIQPCATKKSTCTPACCDSAGISASPRMQPVSWCSLMAAAAAVTAPQPVRRNDPQPGRPRNAAVRPVDRRRRDQPSQRVRHRPAGPAPRRRHPMAATRTGRREAAASATSAPAPARPPRCGRQPTQTPTSPLWSPGADGPTLPGPASPKCAPHVADRGRLRQRRPRSQPASANRAAVREPPGGGAWRHPPVRGARHTARRRRVGSGLVRDPPHTDGAIGGPVVKHEGELPCAPQ